MRSSGRSATSVTGNVKYALESGAKFDFGHFWEDICFKNGPLIALAVFAEKVGPHYRRITDLLGSTASTSSPGLRMG